MAGSRQELCHYRVTGMPMPSKSFLQYLFIAVIALIFFGLIGFYLILNKQNATIEKSDIARGYQTLPTSLDKNDTSSPTAEVSNIKETAITDRTGENSPKTPQRLWQVTRTPVAGMGFVVKTASSTLYFAERSSGYIFAATPKTGTVTRLSNRLFPKIYDAYFDETGGIIFLSINEDGVVTTFSGTISASSTLLGKFLQNEIRALSINRKTGELFYLRNNSSGDTLGVISARDGSRERTIFSSPLSNWRPIILSDGRTFVAQNASDNVPGYAYEIKGGALTPVLRGIPGLTFLPRKQSDAVLFSTSGNGALQLYAIANGSRRVPLKTIAEKCVWSSNPEGSRDLIAYCAVPQTAPAQNFLEAWYHGKIYTSDDWWRVNATDGTVDFLYSPEAGLSIDVENPTIDGDDETIAFINRKDQTLWILHINEKAG